MHVGTTHLQLLEEPGRQPVSLGDKPPEEGLVPLLGPLRSAAIPSIHQLVTPASLSTAIAGVVGHPVERVAWAIGGVWHHLQGGQVSK